MNADELKKESEEWLCNNLHSASEEDFIKAMIDIAEPREKRIAELEKENAELRKIAEFQQSSNMSRHFENKKLKEGLAVGSTFNKALNSMNKSLEEERDKYRDMVFDLQEENAELKEQCSILADCNTCTSTCKTENIEMKRQLTNAKEIIKDLMCFIGGAVALHDRKRNKDIDVEKLKADAENFLTESEVEE